MKDSVLIGWLKHSIRLLQMHHYERVYDPDTQDKLIVRDDEFLGEIIKRIEQK